MSPASSKTVPPVPNTNGWLPALDRIRKGNSAVKVKWGAGDCVKSVMCHSGKMRIGAPPPSGPPFGPGKPWAGATATRINQESAARAT